MPRVIVNISATGDQQLVAAPPQGQFIRVLGGELSAVAAQSLVLLKSGANTAIWRTVGLNTANSNVQIAVDSQNTIDCTPGEALNINNAASGNVSGSLEYVILGRPPAGS